MWDYETESERYGYIQAVTFDGFVTDKSEIIHYGECFPAGTPVLMADGTQKMIETIQVGDYVKAHNIETNKFFASRVTEVKLAYTERLAMVLAEGDIYFAMAEGHPVYTIDGYHSITNKDGYPTLVVGDKMLTVNGYKEILEIQVVDTNEPVVVYSLCLDNKNGNYFVGQSATAVETHSGGNE